MKKVLNLVLALVLTLSVTLCLAACGSGYKDDGVFRVGIITLHDESSTYDKNFIDAAKEVKKTLNLSDEQVIIKSGIPEGNECYNEAVKLIKQGCDVIFADSFGHEDYLIKAAKKYPKVQFCHATGTQAHTVGLKNFHNAFASIYEGRYLAGVAAGIKLNAMINNPDATKRLDPDKAIIGYVGAFTYAEVMSGYTSFFLGAKSVCPSVTMKVSFTGSWYDYAKEKEIAKKLIENEGCVLISQHADSQGCPEACEAAGVPNVFYNGTNTAKTTWLASSKIDWAPYFTIIMDANKQDQIPTDYTGTISTDSVKYYLNEADPDIVADKALDTDSDDTTYSLFNKAEADIKAGTIKVFDTKTFKVKGETITSYMADVDTDKNFEADTEAIEGGIFTESSKRSAPYFNIEIDGITLLDRNYGD
jgi:basic membrane protein A